MSSHAAHISYTFSSHHSGPENLLPTCQERVCLMTTTHLLSASGARVSLLILTQGHGYTLTHNGTMGASAGGVAGEDISVKVLCVTVCVSRGKFAHKILPNFHLTLSAVMEITC
ncbi:hypothetical protein E2C01_038896 [Portunus trituberculatus]|uniref:Uncharacterized protein n=1 Tax=Portunus trituberculatus TaxID=210409 RepID=A0A5B7FLA3_PORTR|nr:hypothetical protein [Portunus trituberculatus]